MKQAKNYFTLCLGLNDKNTKTQLIETKTALQRVASLLLNKYELPGATLSTCNGIYKHDNGEVVFENTIKIELAFIDESIVNNIVSDLLTIFNQESIMKTGEVKTIEFLDK